MAESELGVLASQCLDRRIADKQILAHEVNAWQDHRNKHHAKANWQFKTADARVKLEETVPSVRVTRATSLMGRNRGQRDHSYLVSQCSDVVQIQRRAPHMVAQRIRQFVIAITDNIGNPICGSDVE